MFSQALDGLGVLVTRPRQQSAEIVDALEGRGAKAIVFPCLEIVAREESEIREDLAGLNPADITIFISRNAAEQGIAYAEGRIAAIGPATARALEAAGRSVDIRPETGFDSEHLLAEPAFAEVGGKTVRIIRGGAGRERLRETLSERGANVEYLSTYERRRPEYGAEELADLEERWRAGGIDAVIVMSEQSLENLFALLPQSCLERLRETALVTPSARVLKEALQRVPGCRAILAAGPGADAICAGVAATRRLRPGLPRDRIGEMSDTDKEQQPSADGSAEHADAPADAPSEVAGDPVEEPPPREVVVEKVVEKRRGASATIAWLALFLALVTVAGVGYLLLEEYRARDAAAEEADSLAALSGQLESTNRSLASLDTRIGELGSSAAATDAALDALRRDLDNRGQLFDSLPPRMTKLERSVASLQGVSVDTRNTYLVAEAEYYLQIANAQLQLAGNAYLASLALRQADDRLLQLGDPALTDTRRAIAAEIAAIDVMNNPDIAGLSLTLASLAQVVDSLPLRAPADAAELAAAAEQAEAQSGVSRAWSAVKDAMSGLVKHTPPGDEAAPLLTPDAEPLIRSNLALQLQAARLAMLRGESTLLSQSLEDADRWLATYFDADSEQVAGARATLAEVGEQYSVSAPPDISGSLRLLRQYKALVEPGE